MALGDYILCCECECKLIYDGDRGQREWWHDRWGKDPEIKCPDCETPAREWVGLTDEEINEWTPEIHAVIQAIEAMLREKNT